MIVSAALAFVHFAAVFGIVGTLFFEWLTMSPTPTFSEATRIQLCDRWYGICAAAVLIVGFVRATHYEKGWAFYTASPYFYGKLALFVLLGVISIYPTIRFIKWRTQMRGKTAPALSEREYTLIMVSLRAELLLLSGIALCASLMARGIGV
jgi:putative membrane protein